MNPPASNRGCIMIVDDEEFVLIALRDMLQRSGYEVVTFSNPLDALEEIRRRPLAVILTDQRMPQLTGLEFLAQAKALQPDATRLLITGVLELDLVIASINKGEIYRFIVKPWLREEFLATIENSLQRYEMVQHGHLLQAEMRAANDNLAAQVAKVAEQNQQLEKLNAALRRNLNQSVQLCLKTLDAYSPILSNQARRVEELCRSMAETIHLPPEQRQVLGIAALLHDVGLIEVPRPLIRKWRETPELLDDLEVSYIQHHPILGQEMVGFVDHLEEVGLTIRAHHERYDGSGYPDRLSGDGIPWLARLLAVAVVYASYSREGGAAEFIRANSSLAFDPEAVRALFRSLPHATLPRKQREVLLAELHPGMVLAEGIYSSSGLLLIAEGQSVSETCLAKLHSHDRVSPIGTSLIVYG